MFYLEILDCFKNTYQKRPFDVPKKVREKAYILVAVIKEGMATELGYARTSTSKQDIENQIIALKQAGVPPENIFSDESTHGFTLAKQRKAFKRVYDLINSGEVSKLFVFELSRIGRSSIETMQLFIEIEQKGVQIISLSPNESWTKISNENMHGIRNIFISMFAWFAEIERKSISERTKLGLERARAEGKHIGRPLNMPDRKMYNKYKKQGLKREQIARVMQIPGSTMKRWVDKWEDEERAKYNRELGGS